MFGPRLNTVFRNRWRALWFALSVLAGVWWSVPRQGEDDGADQKQAAEAVAQMIGQPQQGGQLEHHVNPWAKTQR